MNLDLRKGPISLSDWDKLQHGSKITDHDGHEWSVVYIDHSSTRGQINLARAHMRSGGETCVSRNPTDGNLIVRYGNNHGALLAPTRRASGVHRMARAA